MHPLLSEVFSFALRMPCGVLLLCIIKRFLPVTKLWKQLVLLAVATLVVNPVVWIGDADGILLTAAGVFTAIPLLCGGQRLARFSVSLLLFSTIVSSAAVLYSLRPPWHGYIHVFAFLFWLCIYLFVRRFIQPQAVQTIRPRLWLLLDALSLLPFGVTVTIALFAQATRTYITNDEFTDPLVIGNERVLLVLLVLAALYSIALLLAVALLAKIEKLERQRLLAAVRQQQYENEEQNRLQVRRMRHDMANHLSAMAGMDDAAMRGYLSKLISSPAMTTGQRFCENEIVNAVLAGKQNTFEAYGIQAQIAVFLPASLPIPDVELCAIFANCIDNAIEACEKCAPESRRITLSARAEKGIFALRLENSMAGTLPEQNGALRTTKKDTANHGLGMAEIQDIVQQRQGILKYGQEDGTFRLQLSIPLLHQ